MDQETENLINQHKEAGKGRVSHLAVVSSSLPILTGEQGLTEEEAAEIFGERCPDCNGTGMEIIPGRGARPCRCRKERIRQEIFRQSVENRPNGQYGEWAWLTDGFASIKANKTALANIEGLTAIMNGENVGRGKSILDLLEKNSASSFFIHGPTGTYKTTMALALMQEAGRRGQKTAYDIGRELIDTLRNYDLDPEKRNPANKRFYSLAQIEERSFPFCLVLDEIEDTASGLTTYTMSTLFRMIEKFKAHKQQLVITSNRSLESLLGIWKYRDRQFLKGAAMAEDYCAKIDRRLQEHCVILELRESK